MSPDLKAISAGTLAHYEGRAEDFREGTRDHDVTQNIEALLRHIESAPPFTLLDFGCGPGRDLAAFTALGHVAIGLDGAAPFVEMARAATGCEVWHQDFLALDLPDARFDGVFANASLFHVPRAEAPRVLRELLASLKPGGVLFASNPTRRERGRLESRPLWRLPRPRYLARARDRRGLRRAGTLFPPARPAVRAAAVARDTLAPSLAMTQRLNVGCGHNVIEGWINLDSAKRPGVDIVCDLETLRDHPIPLPDGSVDEFLLSHVIEHVRDSLGLMQELWRLARPGASAVIRVPHGGSDDAWEDPTHVRAYFAGSFGFLSQPHYWRADYGYRADWQPEVVHLFVDKRRCEGLGPEACYEKIRNERNLVREMVCELRAVKPAREPRREAIVLPRIEIQRVD